MPRYRLDLEYDGGPFVGWQRQDNGPSVQQALEEAIARFAGHEVRVQGAGRTDTGVHALRQVAHVDLDRDWPADTVRDATNHHLKPAPVSVLAAAPVPDDFHARFSAVGRAYVYRLLDRRSPPALDRGRVWHVVRTLDTDAMAAAAGHLVGRHDFTTFRAAQCQSASPVKTLDALEVSRVGAEVHVNARARSFLHNQVRSMVGTLVEVGLGRWRPEDVSRALAACDRAACGPVAPPQGLYLSAVRYPGE
ncbi:tRNA pseudouridine(38-40) synthase TruA [Futiania mangrovi]|uniref:tRNA pseudouridine synthase A n=1 Tax=Futiania mangrovi TaxID=2959716 RepID=A0A9J6PIX1_9PROT|nr:tRNA pseudouridine(38-40) synthase TruA [Futiania mangrovii]MCP1337760.1 tRNA pseudouridine(38-40) synthase TruA [Futiania mangrovii]